MSDFSLFQREYWELIQISKSFDLGKTISSLILWLSFGVGGVVNQGEKWSQL